MSEARFRLSRCTGVAKAHTLVVDHAHGQECQKQCPWAGRGDCVNDIVNLGRKTSSRELGSSKHRAKGRRRVDGGGHCIDGWPGRADKVYDSSSDGSRWKGGKEGLCLFRWTLRTGRRQTRVGGPEVGGGSGQRKEMERKERSEEESRVGVVNWCFCTLGAPVTGDLEEPAHSGGVRFRAEGPIVN